MHKRYLYLFLWLLSFGLNAQNSVFQKQLDSIHKLRKLSRDYELGLETRINYAKQAVDLSKKTDMDSIVLNSDMDLAWVYLHDVKYFDKSKKILHRSLKPVYKSKDSLSIIYINYLLGYIHSIAGEKKDSAYYYCYKALGYYKNASFSRLDKHTLRQASLLRMIARLQMDEKDYLSSQTKLIQAINLILSVPESDHSREDLSDTYNAMGLNLKNLKEYDKSLDYFQKSLELSNKISNKFQNKLFVEINKAELYKVQGKYKEVIEIYNKLLKEPELFNKDPASYGAILCNMAYTMYLDKDSNIAKIDSLFNESHAIFEDLQLSYELSASSNDMSEFYYAINDKEKALFYAEKAYNIGKDIRKYEEELRALKQLSRLKEGDEGKEYLYKYIALNDSLIANERNNRNKFARIQFETDQYIKETERLSTQNILISIIGASLLLSLGLLYFIRLQKVKNQKLLLEKEQEQANQEIYSLMLRQQGKLEEARMQERHRIAEDLHDGILSQLLGTRMNMGFLDLKGNDDALADYYQYLEEIQKIEKEIRALSHELKGDDLLAKTNFETLMDQYLKTQSQIGGFKYELVNRGVLFHNIKDVIKVNIYRILQESVQNIIKHAKAKHVWVNFYLETKNLNFIVEDDGVGFDVKTDKKGIGLKNMKSRVEKFNGSLTIESVPNKKTTIHIIIPV
ncbi:sensor histidine kinase [Flavobacteriaceae bacterium XHP0103]|uniref:tetratricopeptide repeat-containing sensor histidine kinase n=1 Tax=Marixanthotalea marina TaxID=2844359 RepID=UPI002989B8CA|nr:sensor histidine kinase [Marixanthotalea marina]MBU3820584.1 sensor histidine kinase [Marixanthotalea marina]